MSLADKIREVGGSMIEGDSRDLNNVIREYFDVKEQSPAVNVTITSPPYADLKTYEADREPQVGIGESYETYLDNLTSVFESVYDITKDSGTLWVVVNTFKKEGCMVNLPGDIVEVCQSVKVPKHCTKCAESDITIPLQADADSSSYSCPNCNESWDNPGWTLQDIVIWDKKRALPYSKKGSLRNVFEYILCFSKSESFKFQLDNIRNPDPNDMKDWWINYPERYHPRGKLPDNIWPMVTPSQGAFANSSVDHPAPFPPELVERIIDLTTDERDIVLDPFAGSGTVCAQAKTMNRTPVGVELSSAYIERYDRLVEELHEKRESKVANENVLQAKQDKFTRVITALRQLRYCRELIRTTGKKLEIAVDELGIKCIFQSPTSIGDPTENPSSFIEMEIELVVNESGLPRSITHFRESLESMQQESPCSSFGITADLHLTSISDLESGVEDISIFSGTDLQQHSYRYLNGKHNIYESEGELGKLANAVLTGSVEDKNTYPPILSPVGIDVTNPSDVCTECGEYEYWARLPIQEEDENQVVTPRQG